jgi:hypothetical protein
VSDIVPTREEAKKALMNLSLALPLFEVDGDVYNAAAIAGIGVIDLGNDRLKLGVFLMGTPDPITYTFATAELTREMHVKAIADWKTALSKLYA